MIVEGGFKEKDDLTCCACASLRHADCIFPANINSSHLLDAAVQ